MRVAIYTRLSLNRDGTTLAVERQENDARKLAEEKGWTVSDVYEDNGASAWKESVVRPAYERLHTDYARGAFEALIVWDLTRLTRQPRQLEDWIDAAKEGFALWTCENRFDLRTPEGQAMARNLLNFSSYESGIKSWRQLRAAKQRAERGQPWGSNRPFGFEKDMITHRPEEAEIVREMYADYIAGVPQHGLMRKLNARGITTSLGKKWTQTGVRDILRNPRHSGLRAHKGEIVGPAEWDPIVSMDTWEAVQAIMEKNKRERGHGPGHNSVKYLLGGIAKCGLCGTPLKTRNRGDSRRRYYTCQNGFHLSRVADPLDRFIEQLTLRAIAEEGLAVVPTAPKVDKEQLLAKHATLRARMNQWTERQMDPKLPPIPAEMMDKALTEFNDQIEGIQNQLREASESPVGLENLLQSQDVQKAWAGLHITRRREVVTALMDIEVQKTKHGGRFRPEDIRVTWKNATAETIGLAPPRPDHNT